MAVQKSKVSRRRRGTRRANTRADGATLSMESNTGENHIRHHVSAFGYYKGKQIIFPKKQAEAEYVSADDS